MRTHIRTAARLCFVRSDPGSTELLESEAGPQQVPPRGAPQPLALLGHEGPKPGAAVDLERTRWTTEAIREGPRTWQREKGPIWNDFRQPKRNTVIHRQTG